MIKRFFVLFAVVCLLTQSFAALADVIMGNDFLEKLDKDEIQELERRRFVVNGPDGYVIPQQEPGEKKEDFMWPRPWSDSDLHVVLPKFQNGTLLMMSSSYIHNGEYWGVMEYGHRYSWPGWVPMTHLLVDYIPDDFNKENEAKFYHYTGNFDAVLASERIVLWQWPGSDREKRVVDHSNFKDISAVHAYKDKDDREWVYAQIEHSYVNSNYTSMTYSWICTSDPGNSDIPSFYPAPKAVKWSPDGIYKWTHTKIPDSTAARYSLSNINKIRTYDSNVTFTDIDENAWYKNAVVSTYEYGIIGGKGKNKFDPDGNLTGEEALMIAIRIHAYYKYGKEEGDRLIRTYISYGDATAYRPMMSNMQDNIVQYCKLEGLISDDKYDYDYFDSPITRAQMVHAWAKILQSKDLLTKNTVFNLPDVNANTAYFEDIVLFYEAGIISGVDTQGTFNPDSEITRAEAATIFVNLVDANKRHSGRTYGN